MPEFKQLVDEVKREVREISAEELRKMKADGEDFSLIDVREREDWYQGIIPDAKTITRGMLELKIDLVTTDKERKIVVYCGGGSRSALSAYMLQRMGFRNVFSLAGGYRRVGELGTGLEAGHSASHLSRKSGGEGGAPVLVSETKFQRRSFRDEVFVTKPKRGD